MRHFRQIKHGDAFRLLATFVGRNGAGKRVAGFNMRRATAGKRRDGVAAIGRRGVNLFDRKVRRAQRFRRVDQRFKVRRGEVFTVRGRRQDTGKMRDAGDFHAAKRGDAGGDVKQFVRLKTAFLAGVDDVAGLAYLQQQALPYAETPGAFGDPVRFVK